MAALTGPGPLVFTDSTGSQRAVPLSALEVTGSTVKLASAWSSLFSSSDATILVALASARVRSGELRSPPVAPPVAAVVFTAVTAGPESNNVTVSITPDTGNAVTAKVALAAKEVDTWKGLADAHAAAKAIGVDAPTGIAGDPLAGTGLVLVSGALGTGLPKNNQTLTAKTGTPAVVLAADGTTTLFVLKPRAGAPSAGIPVKITVDTTAQTFTVEASYDSGAQPKAALPDLATLPAPLAFLIKAAAPPGGYALPKAGDVRLSGGALNVPASTIAYSA